MATPTKRGRGRPPLTEKKKKKREKRAQKAKEEAAPPTTIEEQRRLMYVAITRAKENLYVTYPKTVNNKATEPSSFLKEAGLTIKEASKK